MNPETEDKSTRLLLDPIGYVRTALSTKVEAARQPRASRGAVGRIELLKGRNFEHALENLAEWQYVWVLFWFHLNPSWRPKVLPPRSGGDRKGVFSTRSPHRPNPLGLSVVRLERIEGLTLYVRDVDMVDGTPVLDLKPYVAYTDAIPEAGQGWLEDVDAVRDRAPDDPVRNFDVAWSASAAEQAAWIEARTGLALRERVDATLSLGPAPHPYRRIRRLDDESLQLAVKEWRVRFAVEARDVRVLSIGSGYRDSQLTSGELPADIGATHAEYRAGWPADRRQNSKRN